MFSTLLIANRGEIACRIMDTAHRLGLRCVAVYTAADAGARHVRLADEAVYLGDEKGPGNYLDTAAVLAAARTCGAEAIHPGYGFLSENADFAESCAEAGLVFVGPPTSAIRAMGSKTRAKQMMEKAGVPLVPGYHGDEQDDATLEEAAAGIGYPVLIKASSGGGGKGMRIVEDAARFTDDLEGARREARAAFGDDRVLIEKYLTQPRHIEVQVFADSHGNFVHLHERDCSVQRRHQKVIEEAPAPGLSEEVRTGLQQAALRAAQAIGYCNAGTVEFIAEGEDYFFMEMNTRLQVEHPVTEMVTGQDLVEWQLRVAAGECLPLAQEDIPRQGHAVEARLYAEDAARDFMPSPGRLVHLAFPDTQAGFRVDAGVESGDSIPVDYDPMIAKVIAHGRDRAEALRRLEYGLRRTEIAGPVTNLAFLRSIAGHVAFRNGDFDTGFVERYRAELLVPSEGLPSAWVLLLAALSRLQEQRLHTLSVQAATQDPYSPWAELSGWRPGGHEALVLDFRYQDEEHAVQLLASGRDWNVWVGEACHRVRLEDSGDLTSMTAAIDGRRLGWRCFREGGDYLVVVDGQCHRLHFLDRHGFEALTQEGADRLVAPMPGKVTRVAVTPGQQVAKGTALMVLEAMKMEHTITAAEDGIVQEVLFAEGDSVGEGVELIRFEVQETGTAGNDE
ncbi:acetyl/propionyl/methylcrotonyl-CoA carboxylase subunit alpha [Fodinicurvata halophila]|uniref:Acetyl/propionyl/methylcrotonyl-CoA carboxylase subunit alpha n=1 Tax=Fodinicurvata halophila TaxID=1419723 RepID=A0ABV8UQ73_9PROT